MKLNFAIIALVACVHAMPAPQVSVNSTDPTNANPLATSPNNQGINSPKGENGTPVPENLVPDFGVTPGISDPANPGSCLGFNNGPIPCNCPPSRDAYIARLNQFVAAGNAFGIPVTFPKDDSPASQFERGQALRNTMQNMNNVKLGQGCPKGAAGFLANGD